MQNVPCFHFKAYKMTSLPPASFDALDKGGFTISSSRAPDAPDTRGFTVSSSRVPIKTEAIVSAKSIASNWKKYRLIH